MIVCLGCGRSRPYDRADRDVGGECPACGDVGWTYLDDALRDPDGVVACILYRGRVRRDLLDGAALDSPLTRDLLAAVRHAAV